MLYRLLRCESQPTVWDNAQYPQYSTYLPDGTCAPLTAENDYSVLGDFKQSQSLLDRFRKILEDYRRIFSLLIQMIKN